MARRWQGRHRAVPPYPAGPALREQGGRFWLLFAAVVLLAVTFVIFFGWRAVQSAAEYEALIESIGEEWPT